ncbi:MULTISPECIES: amidohydrolase family protein [Rhodococcus]|uniref:amidohydrolase family protein n=1 Tax=Rhodococcus TaxID=1827 RepID=UPI000C9BA2CE|nr:MULTISPECIES: amidohydrolase family protein [Rhodococcus]PND51836.1 amidohydrolase [Rhodococcus sp. ENV425]WKX00295.1 amidohydrolase family protein [Rhodococcus aetherivorans]
MSRRVLIRGGYIIPTAPENNDIPEGDILIEDGLIVAVGPSIEAEADEIVDATGRIVIPGLIDTHRHMWETVLRNMLPDGDLMDYFQAVLSLGQFFRPEDVYTSNLLGATAALNGGITTILDWSHISNSPEHSDAAIAALQAAKIRAVYAHSVGLHPVHESLGVECDNRHPEDIRRIVEQYRTTDENLLTLAAAVRGPEFSTYGAAWDDVRLARELGLRMTIHVGCSALGARNSVETLGEQGLLGSDITYVHANTCSDGALKLIADSGGTISSSPAVEAVMGHGAPAFARFDAVGLRPSLSVDAEVGVSGDLFGQMRSAYEQSRMVSHTILREGGQATLHTTRDVLAWATIEGARALGLDRVTGSIEVGKQADIVLVDLNGPETGPVNSAIGAVVLNAGSAHVTDVFVAGHGVKRNGVLMDVDIDDLVADGENTRHQVDAAASAAGLTA